MLSVPMISCVFVTFFARTIAPHATAVCPEIIA